MLELLAVFIFFFLFDIAGHLFLKTKRGPSSLVVLAAVTIGMVSSAVLASRPPEDGNVNTIKDDVYIAYRYLAEGYPEEAAAVLGDAGSKNNPEIQFFEAAVKIQQKDYIHGHFLLERAADSTYASSKEKKYIEKMKGLCASVLENKSAQEDADNLDISGILDGFIDAVGYSDKEREEYQKDYEVDKLFMDGYEAEYTDINSLEDIYGNTQKVLQLKCKYYVQAGNYEAAKETAKELVDKYNNVDNHIIYTDIIAQEIYESGVLDEDLYEGLLDNRKYGNNNNSIYEKQVYKDTIVPVKMAAFSFTDKLDNDADDVGNADKPDDVDIFSKEGAQEVLKRTINYINAKKGGRPDNTGMYDLQLAKLYMVAGDEETAGKCLEDLVGNSVNINENSKIKKEIDAVVTLYNQIKGSETDPRLDNAVNKLVQAQSSGIVPLNRDTVNGAFDTYVSNTLKYDKISVFISRIDTSAYPEIQAYININGTKDGKSGLAAGFGKSDFTIQDTQYGIDDFVLLQGEDSNKTNIGLVLDQSGSMDGAPVEDAKAAAAEVVRNMDTETHKTVIISYNSQATLQCGLSNNKESLYEAVNNIWAGGNTNIASGLMAGINAIENEPGARAVILMSDGRDNGSREDMEEALARARTGNIAVFTVAFGDYDTDYMKNIAESTGGIFIPASGSEDLSYIYHTLQRYIVNNYCIRYTIKDNPDADPRYLRVQIEDYGIDAVKDYWLDEENKPDNAGIEDGYYEGMAVEKIQDGDIGITSISPGNVSMEAVEQGIKVVINGHGFDDAINVSVGGYLLTDIKTISKESLTGTLKGTLTDGQYSVLVKNSKGKTAEYNGLTVFRGGISTEVKLGGCTITADSIKQVAVNSYVASGNVLLNGFIHCDGYVNITSDNITDIALQAFSGDSANIGTAGTISGTGKMYVNYPEGGELDDSFTNLAMEGKDYIIQYHGWSGDVTTEGVKFDNDKYTFMEIEIPHVLKIDLADIELKEKRLDINITSAKMDDLLSKINDSIKGGSKSSSKDSSNQSSEGVQLAKTKYNSFDFEGFEWNARLSCKEDGLYFGGEIKANVNDSIQFGTFNISDASFKLDSQDKDKAYWKIEGNFDFNKRLGIKGGAGAAGFGGSLSSYYWFPDTVSLNLDMEPGIPVYEVFEITQLRGSLQGMSSIALGLYTGIANGILKKNVELRKKETGFKNVVLSAGLKANANLLNIADIKKVPVIKNIKECAELGTIEADASLQFYNPFELSVKAELVFFGQKAKADVSAGQSGFAAGASVDIKKFKILCLELSGSAKTDVWAKSESAGVKADLKGQVKSQILGIKKEQGAEAGINATFEYRCQEKILSIVVKKDVNGREKTSKVWYDANENISLFHRLHYEEY